MNNNVKWHQLRSVRVLQSGNATRYHCLQEIRVQNSMFLIYFYFVNMRFLKPLFFSFLLFSTDLSKISRKSRLILDFCFLISFTEMYIRCIGTCFFVMVPLIQMADHCPTDTVWLSLMLYLHWLVYFNTHRFV